MPKQEFTSDQHHEAGDGPLKEHRVPTTGELQQIPTLPPPPDSAESLSDWEPHDDKAEKKKARRGLLIGVGSVAAGAALAIGVAMGASAGNNEAPKSLPVATAPASPSPETSPNTAEQTAPQEKPLTVEAMRIPAGLSTAELGNALIERLNLSDMGGATEANFEKYLAGSLTSEGFAQQVAAENSKIFTDALVIPGENLNANPNLPYERYPWSTDLKEFVAKMQKNNTTGLGLWLSTYKSYDLERSQEGYVKGSKIVNFSEKQSVEQTADGIRIVQLDAVQYNNAEKSGAINAGNINGAAYSWVFTLKNSNGYEVISEFRNISATQK